MLTYQHYKILIKRKNSIGIKFKPPNTEYIFWGNMRRKKHICFGGKVRSSKAYTRKNIYQYTTADRTNKSKEIIYI